MSGKVDPFVLKIVAIFSVGILVSLLVFLWKFTAPQQDTIEKEEEKEKEKEKGKQNQRKRRDKHDDTGVREPQTNNRAYRRMMRNRIDDDNNDDINNTIIEKQEGEEGEEEIPKNEEKKDIKAFSRLGVLSKKKLKKLQDKEDRAKYREALEAKKKSDLEEEDKQIYERHKRRLLKEEAEQKEEEELDLARQERERKDLEVYNSLKHQFSVEESGNLVDSISYFDNNIQKFIDEVKKTKVVFVEEMAVKYEVKTQVIVDKIAELEADGKLSGIIDERGKYIYLTEEELNSVAMFVKQRGRVNVLDIQKESNRLICLNPQVTIHTEEEKEEEKKQQ